MLARPRGPLGLAAMAVLTAVLLAACGQSANAGRSGSGSGGGRNPDELVFAAVPSENAQSLQQAYQPLITLLQRATGKKIRFQSATSYSSAIEAQRANKADFEKVDEWVFVRLDDLVIGLGGHAHERGVQHVDEQKEER